MTKIRLISALTGLLLSFTLSAQISEGGKPLAQKSGFTTDDLTPLTLPALNIDQIRAEDDVDQKMGNYPKIGRVIPVNFPLHQYAEATSMANGSMLYQIKLRSAGAMGLALMFENFDLPAGAKLFIHSPDFSKVLGAYTQANNSANGQFSTELIASDEVIVEYYEPIKSVGQGSFTISGVLHAYRMVPGAEEQIARDFGDSDPCQVNVNCSEGNNWQNQKRGIVRILVFEGPFAGWCSGSLVNNTAQNCTPYILTALHCGENASTNNMNQWIFYFNYEASGCSNPGNQNQVPNQTMTGCARIADSGDGGGDNGSDYMLVQINNSIPNNYNPYYNGWSAVNTTSSSGVSIHHPAGDIKKISTYNANLVNSTWGGAPGTHWRVNWVSTTNGHGVTEGGSSGSPIFNAAGRIIGTLTGGTSFCTTPTTPDYYGKMSYHWASNPGDNLRDYLAPGSPATTTLDGTNQPCGGGGGGDCVAGAVFSTATQNVCPGETGTFNTLSLPSIPTGGGYAVLFETAGGTGGVAAFAITDVTLPFVFDNDINGTLSFNDLDPLSGAWTVSGFVYTDPANAFASLCSETTNSFTINFLAANDPLCTGGGGDNNTCANATAIVPGSYPFSTINATTDGPAQPGSPCDVFGQNNVHNDIWFTYTATCNGTASFSTCNTATFDTRIAVYPGGQCPPTAGSLIGCNDDGVDCTGYTSFIQWAVVAGNTYLLRLGGYNASALGTGTVELIETCAGSDCASTIPYPLSDPCVIQVIAEDAFCCDNTWDSICQDAYNDCAGIEGPCLSWAQPTTTTAWENFNITYDGAPCNDGTGCPVYSFTTFEVWGSEAYIVDNVLLNGTYTFSHCAGPGAGSWIPEYTIIAPSGAVDAFGGGNGDGCSITWTASEAGSYLIVINQAGNCGVANQIDNGFPALTCDNNTMCDGVITSIADAAENDHNFTLFPNPNKGQFVIEHSGNGSLAQIDIMDVSGRMIQAVQINFGASSRQDIDLGKQASGIYFVRITHEQKIEVLRVIVH
jgi:hypothetical protein